MANPTAAIIVIGDEILSGRTRDINMNRLAISLANVGIDLTEARVVPDDQARIAEAINAVRGKYTHVFTSGGIGPTHDDITADSVAAAFGVAIAMREDARLVLANHYPNGAADLNEARLRMARIPNSATLIDNPVSGAPGFTLENVHVMAGVPAIFAAMLDGLLPKLGAGSPMSTATVRVDKPEGDIAGPLVKLAEACPDVSIGSYPFHSSAGFGSNIVIRGGNADLVEKVSKMIADAFGIELA